MKQSVLFFLFIVLFFSSCDTKTASESLVPGRIADIKWFFPKGDTLLWIYSLYSTEHSEYSSSSIDKTSTYSHENGIYTAFLLKNNKLQLAYQAEPSCINHQECGTRYTDKVIAYSSDLIAFKCDCEGKLIIIDAATGKNWTDLPGLKQKFKECAPGISKYGTPGPSRPDVLELEILDGTVVYLSLESKHMTGWDKSFDYGSEVNRGSYMAHISGQKIYFAPNDGDHRSFLVVRGEKSGTSQDYKHQMGTNYWLNPKLLNQINQTEAYVQDDCFFALHSKTWNEYGDTDLLSKINTKGETQFTIELKELGNISSYLISGRFIYMTTAKAVHVYDSSTGKKITAIYYDQVKNTNQQAT